MQETWVRPDTWGWKIPQRRKWQFTPVLLPGQAHGQRSQVGYNLWGREESNRTKWLSVHAHTHTHTLPAVVNECLALQEHLKFLVTTKVCHNPQPSTSDNPSGSRVFSVAPVLTKKKPTALPDSHTWTCLPRLGKLPPLLFSCSLRMVAASSVPDNYLDFGIILFALWFSFT